MPTRPNDPADQYFVLDIGGLTYERTRAERCLPAVIADIIGGQFDRIGSVLRVNVADYSSADASEDVARAVLNRVYADRDTVSENLRNFIEDHCGAHSADCVLEAA